MSATYRTLSSKMAKYVTTLYLDEDVRDHVHRLKQETGRPISWWVNTILRQHAQAKAERERYTKPAFELLPTENTESTEP
jgi:hypothetical protein